MRCVSWIGAFAVVLLVSTAPVGAADNPPGILHSTLLNGVKLDFDSHEFYIERFTATFLPEPQSQTGSIYKYNPDDGDSLQATLTDADGNLVLRLGFYGNLQEQPFWIIGSYKFLENNTGNEPSGSRIKLAAGKYVLDFFVKGEKFYHFPFEITEIASEDAFAPEPYRFLEGDWNDWGYIHYLRADPEMNMFWKVWLRTKSRNKSLTVRPTMKVFRGDTLVAVGNENYQITLQPEWNRFEFQMNHPPGQGGYLKAKDILGTDGDYRIEIQIDGETYGTWGFQVAEGKLAYTGRTARGEADPLTFVEGGRDAWWYARRGE
ncbi:MAG: hypothetical protein ACYTG6_09780 [Planctomycetota bacterium]